MPVIFGGFVLTATFAEKYEDLREGIVKDNTQIGKAMNWYYYQKN